MRTALLLKRGFYGQKTSKNTLNRDYSLIARFANLEKTSLFRCYTSSRFLKRFTYFFLLHLLNKGGGPLRLGADF